MKTIFVDSKKADRKWYLIDANGKTLGRVAVKIATILRGKNKPEFAPHQENGDFVVVVNADKIAVTGGKMQKKTYHRYSGYPGGLTTQTLAQVMEAKPTMPLEEAVRRMLPKNRLGRKVFKNVKFYVGTEHPHAAQKPIVLEI